MKYGIYLFVFALILGSISCDSSSKSNLPEPGAGEGGLTVSERPENTMNRPNERAMKTSPTIFDRFVALGDSITHGCHCLTVDEVRQAYSWPAMVAEKMDTEFNQALVKFPGFMINLEDIGKENIKWFEYYYPLAGGVRVDNFADQENLNNFGISSATVDHIISPPVKTKNVFFNNLLGTILPYHRLVIGPSGRSAVEQALDRDPTFISLWIGSNDTLISAVIMMDIAITPKKVFEESWNFIVEKILQKESVEGVVVGNIPNLMHLALFEPNPDGSYKSLWQPDYDDIGEIMSKEEADKITGHIEHYNNLIEETAVANGWAFADANHCFCGIKQAGSYELKHSEIYTDKYGRKARKGSGKVLGSDYLEGLYSLDGIHPTITGYAVFGNLMINAINTQYGTELEYIDEYEIYKKDTLCQEPFDPRPWANSWVFQTAYNIYKIIL